MRVSAAEPPFCPRRRPRWCGEGPSSIGRWRSRAARGESGALAAALLALTAVASAFAGASTSAASGTPACGTVTLNENSWVGSIANVYVVKNVLESKLKCKVIVTQFDEIPVYKALSAGKVDAVLEDWQHVDQYTQYEQKLKTVEDAGSNGLTGHSRLVRARPTSCSSTPS